MVKTEDIFAKLAEFDKLRKQGIRALLKQRRKIDRQLVKLGHSAEARLRRSSSRTCRTCGKKGHNSRTCPMAKGKKG